MIETAFLLLMQFRYKEEVQSALMQNQPVVALESTVISHGLPYPQNIETARQLEDAVRQNDAVPATIAVLDGEFCVGLENEQIERLARSTDIRKISRRDLPIAAARRLNCATTVATTLFIAHRAGIRIFATGGIGGVHRGSLPDISADLPELSQTPMTVVCAGAKAILDLPATREWLETHGVCVLGWQSDQFPAFYSRQSGLNVDERVDSAEQVAAVIRMRDQLELPNAILLTAPIPAEFEIPSDRISAILDQALAEAHKLQISGKETTPFLLSKLSELSQGETLRANIALLKNNAEIAARVACAI